MIPVTSYSDDLQVALDLADAVDPVTMRHFGRSGLAVRAKPDLSLVSEADEEAERTLRIELARVRPDDAVQGEEFPDTGSGQRRWIVDPIDGTHSYVRGVPVWATLIALIDGSEPVVGVVSAPALGRRWWASSGDGAWTGGPLAPTRQIAVSEVSSLNDASLSYSSLRGWEAIDRGEEMLSLIQRVWRSRAYGDFYSYMLLAEGAVDIATEPELNTYDMAALVPIVNEAGGTFTSLDGRPGPWGGNAIATNGELHLKVLAQLGF